MSLNNSISGSEQSTSTLLTLLPPLPLESALVRAVQDNKSNRGFPGQRVSRCFGSAVSFVGQDCMKTNLPTRRRIRRLRWRIEQTHDAFQHIHNGGFLSIEAGGELGFQIFQLPG